MPMAPLERTDGEYNRRAKLNWQQVAHIRASFAKRPADWLVKDFCASWGALFGVSRQTIQQVVNGYNWRDVANRELA